MSRPSPRSRRPPPRPRARPGRSPVVGQVLDLDVDAHAVARVQRLGEVGIDEGRSPDADLDDDPAVGQLGVVVPRRAPSSVRADVELDPVGPQLASEARRPRRVFSGAAAERPDGRSQRSWHPPSTLGERNACRSEQRPVPWLRPRPSAHCSRLCCAACEASHEPRSVTRPCLEAPWRSVPPICYRSPSNRTTGA